MVLRDGKSINEVALELGVAAWTLRCWKKKQLGEAGSAELLSAADLDKENRQLRRELERVKRQREILKKLWASYPKSKRLLQADENLGARSFRE